MSKKKSEKKAQKTNLYMINCISMHRIRYCIEADEESLNKIKNEFDKPGAIELTEFSSEFIGEKVVSIEFVPDKEAYLKIFNKDNAYLGRWNDDKKMEFINKKYKKGE